MKRKVLLSLVGAVGAATVIGSGFSAWFFGNSTLEASGNIGTKVTDLNEGTGTLTNNDAGKTLTVVLDQGGYENKGDVTKGISIHEGDIDESDLTQNLVSALSATYSIEEENATTLKNTGIHEAKFTATFTLSDAAANYVKFHSTYTGGTGLDGTVDADCKVFTYTKAFDLDGKTATDGKISETYTFDVATTDGVNAMLQYKSKPTSETEYNAMKTALTGNLLSIAYSFVYTLPTA